MILCADALVAMKMIPSGSVACVVTDPPYRNISGGTATPGQPTGILSANDGTIFAHNSVEFDDYLPDLFRVLRDPGHLYLMVNFHNLEVALAAVRRAGFDIHNLLVWHKPNATPNRWYMKNAEYIIFARKGAAFSINDCGSKTVQQWPNPSGNRLHPTEKPVAMLQHWIENSTQIGDLVLDPFAGSGSTGVAARQAGRRFVGIEIDPEFASVARNRK